MGQMPEEQSMTHLRRLRLTVEMALLYVAAPIAVYHFVYVERLPLFRILPWAMGALLVLLFLERNYDWTKALARLPRPADLLKVLGLFVICGGVLTLYAYHALPQYFLAFPERAPDLWLRVMILYPALSVTTQEILYRVFYFHRYACLFGQQQAAAVVFNALLFAFMHATLFAYRHSPFHWPSVAISLAGGLLFAYRFYRTRSFWTVALEHGLYGDLLFTTGLGIFFFTGVANL
jgi:membrane protease YdiL (CAAX protease family)